MLRGLIIVFGVLAIGALLPSVLRGQHQVSPAANFSDERAKEPRGNSVDTVRPSPSERDPRYQINRDDVLQIFFPLSPEFNQARVMVQPDGYLTLLGVPAIRVAGLTVSEITEAVKKAYSKVLHEPIVEVDLLDFQRAHFVVLGQVAKPGQYDLRYATTVTEAIAIAGGFASTAKTQVFLYHRGHDGWVEAKELKLKDILQGKNVVEDIEMRSGDMIFVPEKTITKVRKYIPYGFGVGTGINTGVL